MGPSTPPEPVLRLLPAEAGQRGALDALILRSKAWWGYDAAMMDIMARHLKIDPIALDDGRVCVAVTDMQPVGVAQISPVRDTVCQLDLLFIDPQAIGTGAGRRLYDWACSRAREGGARRLDILSDPGARGFYEHVGAHFVEDRASKAVPGRWLPWLEHSLD